MGGRPLHNEVLQAADLSASATGVRKGTSGVGKSFLLAGCLFIWSFGVTVFFSRESRTQDPEDGGTEIVGVTPTPAQKFPAPTAEILLKPSPTPPPQKKVVQVESRPAGARVLLENTFVGETPFQLENPGSGKTLWFQLSGYESLRIPLGEDGKIVVDLVPIQARVWLEIYPPESRLFLNGALKEIPKEGFWDLPVRSHELRVEAKGFETRTLRFTPAEAYERKIQVRLSPVAVPPAEASKQEEEVVEVSTVQGLEMVLPELPLEATLGSARGTAGRQSNELQINVKLTRAFRISKMEISNKQFRAFKPAHNSGRWKRVDLNGDSLPVSGVSWEEAVAYCNWLSGQEGLPPAYALKEGGWEFQEKPGTGYRLPTEAEWESVARMNPKQTLFGWGDEMPPPQATVNVAGKESAKFLTNHLQAYSDRFAGPAPVDQAGEGPLGLMGLYGNVCEWVQDGYSIPPVSSRVFENPLNTAAGQFHVMKGASWQDAGIGDLRIARRRYGKQAANDLGFRVARYVEAPSESVP
ncbi:SUMF1/EgtB/PvdO family nonheme iron enzyme [Kiritimatiellaeota bacterium B1221]|nr:SUMF1/EgtB/PvdO family nonheme iron enzyme [Kiritimatiellaeota bacterium B1221]